MSEKNKENSHFISSIYKFSLATWINAIIYGIAVLLITLFVDKAIFGLFDLMLNTANTLMSIVTLGFDYAYLRFWAEPPKGISDNKQISLLGLIVSGVTLSAVSIVFFLIPQTIGNIFFNGQREDMLLISMCFTCLAMVVIRFLNIAYRMQNNILMFSVATILLQFFTRIFYIFGVLISKDFTSIVLFYLSGLVLFILLFILLQGKVLIPKRYEIGKEAYAPLFKYSLGIMPSSVLLWGNQLVSKLFVSAALDESALGLFSFATLITSALGVLQGGFASFWSAFMFANYRKEQKRIMDIHDLLMFIMMMLICLFLIASPLIFAILSSFSESSQLFGLLLFAPLLMIVSETTAYGIDIAKKTILNTLSSLICVVVNIISCAVLIPPLKLHGAALAYVISTTVMFVFRTVIAQRFYRSIHSYRKTAVSLSVVAVLCFISPLLNDRYIYIAALSLAAMGFFICFYINEGKLIVSYISGLIAGLRKNREL